MSPPQQKTVTANIKANSIGLDKLSLSVVSTLEGYMTSARDSATAAKTSETNARASELSALEAKSSAEQSAEDAEYWARIAQENGGGGGGITEIPVATADTLGGIKVGEGLEITEDGVLSSTIEADANVSMSKAYFNYDKVEEPVTNTFLQLTNTKLEGIELDSSGNPILKAGKSYKVTFSVYTCNLANVAGNEFFASMTNSQGGKTTLSIIYPIATSSSRAGQNCSTYTGVVTPDKDFSLQIWMVNPGNNEITKGCTALRFNLLIEEIIDTAVFIANGEIKEIDDTPTEGSENVVTSGGVHTALANKADVTHTQNASTITAGTFAGRVVANGTEVATLNSAQVRNIVASTIDLTAGTSTLASGNIHLVYE